MSAALYVVRVMGAHLTRPLAVLETADFARAALEADMSVQSELYSVVSVTGTAADGDDVLVVPNWADLRRPPMPKVSRPGLSVLWCVAAPTPDSVLSDVLFSASVPTLARMFVGGLDPETVQVFADYGDAHFEAFRLLAARGKVAR